MDLGCHIEEGFKSVVSNQFDAVLRELNEAALQGLHSLSTFWIKVPSPTLASGDGQDWTNSAPVAFLQGNLHWLTATIFTLAILIAGLRIAWEQRAEPVRQLLKAMMLFALVASAGSAVVQLLTLWADEFSQHLVSTALPARQTFDGTLANVVMNGGQTAQKLPILIAMFAGMMALVSSLIQIVLLLIRSAMLVLLAGAFPLAAAATNTEVGKAWFKKFCGWALAFIAYKPAAALIYAAAIRMSYDGMSNEAGDGLVQVLTGLMMLALAVVALPALLRFTVPLTAAAAGGAAASGASVVDPGGLASGAINVGRSSSSGGGSGGGSGGPSSRGGGISTATGAIGVAAGGGSGSGSGSGGGSGSGSGSGAGSGSGSGSGAGSGSGSGSGGGSGSGSGSGGGSGGGGGGGGGGAISAAAGAAGSALSASKKATGAMSGAVSHSAGESGGGSASGSSSPRTSGPGSTSSRPSPRGSSSPRSKPPPPPPPPAPPSPPSAPTSTPTGPTGNW
ncbi:type IV secretion system protein [Kribbella sp. NPDC056861]|uniref:type IV secretion system protein n=1 Tax=Kribbella sp. NPDC056861 TaxID=3154857 RepID=UPI003420A141